MEIYNPFSLIGKTILVTGASSGIGRSIAIEASKMGATLIITGRDKERLNETYTSLMGNNHLQFIADLNESEAVDNLVDSLPSINGGCSCARYWGLASVSICKKGKTVPHL